MDYATYVLQTLLNKYESSKGFITGYFTQRISLVVGKDKILVNKLELAEEKESFLEALSFLKGNLLIDFSWVKYEQNNLVERVWLNLDNVSEAYRFVKRQPKESKIRELYCIIGESYKACHERTGDSAICLFLAEELEKIFTTKRGTAFFREPSETARALLKALVWLNNNDCKDTERLLSVELYNDSKYFERYVKGKLLAVLRHISSQQAEISVSDEDLLLEYGLSRWPEVYEFLGNLKVELYSGDQTAKFVDYSGCIYGAYIDSTTVGHIKNLDVHDITKVLFIENKANYEWYKGKNKPDELLVFHGGYYGLMKGKWFECLYDAVMKQNSQAQFYHWSDIDLGGFNIFVRLRNLIPELQPYKMDLQTYEQYVDMQSKTITDEYRKKLEQLLVQEKFNVFHDVIKAILHNGKTLEQEQIIIGN